MVRLMDFGSLIGLTDWTNSLDTFTGLSSLGSLIGRIRRHHSSDSVIGLIGLIGFDQNIGQGI